MPASAQGTWKVVGTAPAATGAAAPAGSAADPAITAAYLESLFAQAYSDAQPEAPVDESYQARLSLHGLSPA